MSKKKHKVIVVGLPKTGTSTLAVMLRMLKYNVTGPENDYKVGDVEHLNSKFQAYDGFQDFPWCFEWQRYFDIPNTKFIVLKRDKDSWWKSFLESYGRSEERYLSFPFMKIPKNSNHKAQFLAYFDAYYNTIDDYVLNYPDRFLSIAIHTFEWKDLCDFLEEELPRTIFGHVVKKPHVNKKKAQKAQSTSYKISNTLKKGMMSIIGKATWRQLIIFLRKNGIVQ